MSADTVFPDLGRAFDAALVALLPVDITARMTIVDCRGDVPPPISSCLTTAHYALSVSVRGYVLNMNPDGDQPFRCGVVMDGAGPEYHTGKASRREGAAAAIARALWVACEARAERMAKAEERAEVQRKKDERRAQREKGSDDAG